MDPEDLIPKLFRPQDLCSHARSWSIRGTATLSTTFVLFWRGQWLASGSDDGLLWLWEVAAAPCVRTVPVGGYAEEYWLEPSPHICLVAVAIEDAVVLLIPVLGARLVYRLLPAGDLRRSARRTCGCTSAMGSR